MLSALSRNPQNVRVNIVIFHHLICYWSNWKTEYWKKVKSFALSFTSSLTLEGTASGNLIHSSHLSSNPHLSSSWPQEASQLEKKSSKLDCTGPCETQLWASKDRGTITSLGNLFEWLPSHIHTQKRSPFMIRQTLNMYITHYALPLGMVEKSLPPSFYSLPQNINVHWWDLLSLLSSRRKSHNTPSLTSFVRSSSPLIILKAFCWTCSRVVAPILYWEAQKRFYW